ncbi:TOBE domain-containing protein [Campylobacter sp. CCUG 57310]|uniref:TOBE domain-containing protein n=1 Tax=Campylobacter sp. CCUG 57310 TaxID=2517362 RepID=UPI00156648BB|nr:TOBE domain-containing protein [Campylobacter sp. CCUG 57310]QKF91514.1 transcriptional regulator, ModE family [Campylobacter sp. CCUG 57310]
MKADISLELFLDSGVPVLTKHINLLKAIDETKSITKAAEFVGISYKNAWDSLDALNNRSDKPLIARMQGNKKNSGSELTEYGRKMINIYEAMLESQKIFLEKVCANIDISTAEIANLQRMSMSLSARNQLSCEIIEIKTGAVSSEVVAKLSNDEILRAVITVESEKSLNLQVGKKVVFIFKAPSVMLAKDENLNISAANQLKGKVIEAKIGSVSAEIVLEINDHQTITAIITKDSAMEMKIGVGDELTAVIKSSQIIIGV